jgi:dTDP-4-dehydrorhamnose reductase
VEKLLVTRPDTLIGANTAAVLADRMDVIAPDAPVLTETANSQSADGEAAWIAEAIRRERPTLVVHSGPTAWSGWDVSGTDGVRVDARCNPTVEASFIAAAAAACRDVGAKLIVATTDAVFSGPRMFHAEEGQSWAATAFAKTARAVEQGLNDGQTLVLRGHVYGWMPQGGATNYAERMFHALTAELPYRVDARRHASPILATDFVRLAYEAYRAGLTGLWNVSGAERTSPHRFAAELAAALGVPGCNVRLEALPGAERRLYLDETSLNVGAIRKRLNRPLPMLREGLTRFVDEAFNGYRDRWNAGNANANNAVVLQAQAA